MQDAKMLKIKRASILLACVLMPLVLLRCMPVPPLRSPNTVPGVVWDMTGSGTLKAEQQRAVIASEDSTYTHDMGGSEAIFMNFGYTSDKWGDIRISLLNVLMFCGNIEWNRALFVRPNAMLGRNLYGSLLLSANADFNIAAENNSQSVAMSMPLGILIGKGFELLAQPSISYSGKTFGYLPNHNGTAGKLKWICGNIGTGVSLRTPPLNGFSWLFRLPYSHRSRITAGITLSRPLWENNKLDPGVGNVQSTSYPKIYPYFGVSQHISLKPKRH